MKNLFLFALLSFALTSCISNTAMQTGRVLEKGEVQITAGLTNIASNSIYDIEDIDADNNTGNTAADFLLPNILEAQGRVKIGLGKKTDIGMSLSASPLFSANLEGEIKHQFIGNNNSRYAVSAALKAGVGGLFGLGATSITVPLYASIHPTDFISFYSSPRFKHVAHSDLDFNNKVNFFGMVNGINLTHNDVDFYFEHGMLFSEKTSDNFGQFNAGIAFTF